MCRKAVRRPPAELACRAVDDGLRRSATTLFAVEAIVLVLSTLAVSSLLYPAPGLTWGPYAFIVSLGVIFLALALAGGALAARTHGTVHRLVIASVAPLILGLGIATAVGAGFAWEIRNGEEEEFLG